jgi:Mg2+/citrate symporter
LIFILVIYILLVTSSRFGTRPEANAQGNLVTKLNAGQSPKVSTLFGLFSLGKTYVGEWQKIARQDGSHIDIEGTGKGEFSDFP